MKFQNAEGGERQWYLISDIEKAHLFSLFVAKTSTPAKCRKIKDTSVSYWLNRHL
ncbi:MAG: hypothetical protein ACLT3T_09785 [Holdemanella porci]